VVAWRARPGDLARDPEALFEALVELSGDELPHTCRKLHRVDTVEAPTFPHDLGNPTPELTQAFEDLREQTARRPAPFPTIRSGRLHASWPDDGQVYWAHEQLLVFPEHATSVLILVQYAW